MDEDIEHIYAYRTWKSPKELGEDPIAYGMNADIPIQGARGKILGPDDEGAIDSLAVKLWMIENAEHTIDFGYYIFNPDIIGYAMIGAMCDAVKRGVDVRFMVDSLGSLKAGRTTLAALKTCENQARFMRNEAGELTTRKARVQVMIFNALSKISTSPNRRSHDKLLIIKEGNVVVDEAASILSWLEEHPGARLEIVTNSVLTSDNFSAQSIIDMDTAPRLLLDQETRDAWRSLKANDEMDGALTSSDSWKRQVNHPRLIVYETGRLDSSKLGDGDVSYGKLHAKFFLENEIGFVGTTNFDYRSRLYNSEMGYFFKSGPLAKELNEAFDYLLETSYRWGSPEWLEMRRKTLDIKGMKGWSTRHQRKIYKTLKVTGLHWLF